MKILVTGTNSYTGTQFAKRLKDLKKNWIVDFISVRNDSWESKDFSSYSAIYHVAAIVHKKESEKNKELYFSVNRDLTYKLALKAKSEGVRSFVFLSSMAVYGVSGEIGKDVCINNKTKAAPISNYGKSKLEAEKLINGLQNDEFKVAILRIPMIYGPDCPGNYQLLRKLVVLIPLFPKFDNERSMIFINHLSDIVIFIIKEKKSGIILANNPVNVNTSEMVRLIAKYKNKRISFFSLPTTLIEISGKFINSIKKIFGNLYYEKEACRIEGFNYENINFEETIKMSENK